MIHIWSELLVLALQLLLNLYNILRGKSPLWKCVLLLFNWIEDFTSSQRHKIFIHFFKCFIFYSFVRSFVCWWILFNVWESSSVHFLLFAENKCFSLLFATKIHKNYGNFMDGMTHAAFKHSDRRIDFPPILCRATSNLSPYQILVMMLYFESKPNYSE